jgi:hypothetical protein
MPHARRDGGGGSGQPPLVRDDVLIFFDGAPDHGQRTTASCEDIR